MYFTFMSELDARFGALEDGDNSMMVDMDKRLTELEINKMTEKQLQEQYIKYLQQRLLKMDDKVCTCGGSRV